MTNNSETPEDIVWKNINPDDIWVLDNLIVSRKMKHNCGPVGLAVSRPVWENENTNPPDGYIYREYSDIHGRIGAFVK